MKIVLLFLALLFYVTPSIAQNVDTVSKQHLSPVQRRAIREQKAISRQKLALAERRETKEQKKARGQYVDELNVHEIFLGYGLPSLITFNEAIMHNENSRLTGRGSYGVASLGYKYYFLRNVAIGFLACHENGAGNINGPSSYTTDGKYTYRDIAIAPQLTILLNKRRNNIMYCSLAIGYNDLSRKLNYYTKPQITEHASGTTMNLAFGGRFQLHKVLCCFAEVDLGFRGMINCGLSLKL